MFFEKTVFVLWDGIFSKCQVDCIDYPGHLYLHRFSASCLPITDRRVLELLAIIVDAFTSP